MTPLLAAVAVKDEALVRRLLEGGARPDDPSASRSPLVQAITSFGGANDPKLMCAVGIVRALLEHGADPNRPDLGTGALPLQTAFDVGDLDCARVILQAGGKATGRERGGRTILMSAVGSAVRKRNLGLIDAAVSWGATVNDRDDEGMTPLHEAVRLNSVEVAKVLLDRGADPCLRSKIGQTPLDMAINLSRADTLIDTLRARTRCDDHSRIR